MRKRVSSLPDNATKYASLPLFSAPSPTTNTLFIILYITRRVAGRGHFGFASHSSSCGPYCRALCYCLLHLFLLLLRLSRCFFLFFFSFFYFILMMRLQLKCQRVFSHYERIASGSERSLCIDRGWALNKRGQLDFLSST
jgi:hypothetical protein